MNKEKLKMEPRMDTKELEEAARYSLQCKKASLEELRATAEETRGMNKEKLIMNRDEKVEERMKNVAWLLGVIRERRGKNERKESAGTQLALQDAQEAEARTREERDALKAENAELREQIRELEHERHCALLQSKANSQDAAHWKQTAEAMTKMFMDVEGELRELKAKVAVKERTEREKGTENG